MSGPVFVALVNPKSGGNVGASLLSRFKEILDEERVYNLSEDGGPLKALQEHLETDNLRIIGKSAAFWRKVLLVLKLILRYGGLKVFFLWSQNKAPRKACRWPHLKS